LVDIAPDQAHRLSCNLASELNQIFGSAASWRMLLKRRQVKMPMRSCLWFVLCALLALGPGGCTVVATVAGSSVVAGDEHGGVVSRVTSFTIDGVMNMASSWCGQYGLIATETQIIFATESLEFACIPSPSAMPKRLI